MIETVKVVELANAMGISEAQFHDILPALNAVGFPMPSRISDEFEVGPILDWVGEQQYVNLSIVSLVTEKLIRKH